MGFPALAPNGYVRRLGAVEGYSESALPNEVEKLSRNTQHVGFNIRLLQGPHLVYKTDSTIYVHTNAPERSQKYHEV